MTIIDKKTVVKTQLTSRTNIFLKRIFDCFLTLIGLIVVLPVLGFIALSIYIDSPGPVIYKHLRVGKNGSLFYCYKLRTMIMNAQEELESIFEKDPLAQAEWESLFKLKDDPRVTKIGKFLRRTSLDELPQLFNVLKGEMSLVGPRPVVQDELIRYGKNVAEYLSVTPGITGYWQVHGRSNTTYEERVQMDIWYIYNWSLWLDIKLLFMTLLKIWHQEGAY